MKFKTDNNDFFNFQFNIYCCLDNKFYNLYLDSLRILSDSDIRYEIYV